MQKRPRTIVTKVVSSGSRSGGLGAPLRTGGFFGVNTRRRMNERKTIDVNTASYVSDTTGTVTLLNGVATGTDFTDRIGRKIICRSLYITGMISPVDNTTAANLARLIVVYDNQTNGAAPAVTDILKEATACSQLNLNNRDRFVVLCNKTWAQGSVSDTATQAFSNSPNTFKVKIYKKLRHEVLFNGTTAAVGSIATGAIWMITIGSATANNGGTFSVSTRTRFEDA